MANKKEVNEIRCSFCGKAQEMVKTYGKNEDENVLQFRIIV